MAAGRPLRIAWQDDAATLEEAYRRERNYQLRPRLPALWLVRQGPGLREEAALVRVDETSMQRWLSWYRQGGLRAVCGDRRMGPGRVAWLSGEQLGQMAAAAAAACTACSIGCAGDPRRRARAIRKPRMPSRLRRFLYSLSYLV